MKLFLLLIVISFFNFGCDNSPEKDNVEKPQKQGIKSITENDLQEIINKRNGKILFLNIWATWCVPCVEEFPAIVKLDQNYKNNNVEIIAISVDLPSEVDDKIIPFLKKQNAEFTVYVAEEKSSDEIINTLNPDWSGAIPASFIFDETGKQRKFLFGAQTYEEMSLSIDSVAAL